MVFGGWFDPRVINGGWRVPSRSAPAVEPTLPAGLFWHIAARLETSYVDNDPVGTGTDQTSGARNVVAVTTSRPTYKTAILDGKAVYRFTGPSHNLTRSTAEADFKFLHDGTGASIYIVAQVSEANPSKSQCFLSTTRQTTNTHGLYMGHRDAAPPNNAARYFAANGTAAIFSLETADTFTDQAWRIMALRHATSAGNDVLATVGNTSISASEYLAVPSTNNPSAALRIGNNAVDNTNPLTGDIAEILIFNAALSDADHATVLSYLRYHYPSLP